MTKHVSSTAFYIVTLTIWGGCNPRNPPLDPPLQGLKQSVFSVVCPSPRKILASEQLISIMNRLKLVKNSLWIVWKGLCQKWCFYVGSHSHAQLLSPVSPPDPLGLRLPAGLLVHTTGLVELTQCSSHHLWAWYKESAGHVLYRALVFD